MEKKFNTLSEINRDLLNYPSIANSIRGKYFRDTVEKIKKYYDCHGNTARAVAKWIHQ